MEYLNIRFIFIYKLGLPMPAMSNLNPKLIHTMLTPVPAWYDSLDLEKVVLCKMCTTKNSKTTTINEIDNPKCGYGKSQ